MENNELYPLISKRRSIRDFNLNPLDENILEEISANLQTLEPLYPDIKSEFKIIEPDMVKRRMMKKAPHYIAAFSEEKNGYLTNIGFMLQQMDLFLSKNGIASCWQGIPAPKKELLESSNLKFEIFIAFGHPKNPDMIYRKSVSEFKRKSVQEITNISGADDILEAARLAPSATNNQPWFFTGNKNLIHAYAIKPSFIRSLMAGKYPFIDVGIALCHLKIAAEHFDKKTEIIFDKEAEQNASKDKIYIASLKVEN